MKDVLMYIMFSTQQQQIKEKVTNQNIELKRQLYEATETIARMGEMFLKMKFTKDSAARK